MPLLFLSECLLRNRQIISIKRKCASTGVEQRTEKKFKEGILSHVSQNNFTIKVFL